MKKKQKTAENIPSAISMEVLQSQMLVFIPFTIGNTSKTKKKKKKKKKKISGHQFVMETVSEKGLLSPQYPKAPLHMEKSNHVFTLTFFRKQCENGHHPEQGFHIPTIFSPEWIKYFRCIPAVVHD